MLRQVSNFRQNKDENNNTPHAIRFLYVSAHFKTNLSLILLPPIEGGFMFSLCCLCELMRLHLSPISAR